MSRPKCDTPGCGRPIPIGGEGHPEICPKCLRDLDKRDAAKAKRSAKLKPCPFCGLPNVVLDMAPANPERWLVSCYSEECAAEGPEHDTPAAARAAWNRRQPSTVRGRGRTR